jgi:hypothetical protein
MRWAALILWLATAGLGVVLFGIWFVRGGVAQQGRAGRGRIRPQVLFPHAGLAVGGLALWIAYLASDREALSWAALAALALVGLLGATMLAVWLGQRTEPTGARMGAQSPAERHFPPLVVAAHGLLAVATVVLVALTAAGVGE